MPFWIAITHCRPVFAQIYTSCNISKASGIVKIKFAPGKEEAVHCGAASSLCADHLPKVLSGGGQAGAGPISAGYLSVPMRGAVQDPNPARPGEDSGSAGAYADGRRPTLAILATLEILLNARGAESPDRVRGRLPRGVPPGPRRRALSRRVFHPGITWAASGGVADPARRSPDSRMAKPSKLGATGIGILVRLCRRSRCAERPRGSLPDRVRGRLPRGVPQYPRWRASAREAFLHFPCTLVSCAPGCNIVSSFIAFTSDNAPINI